ncbi:fumarate hydratase class II [Peptoniphilus koenoeneniae]|uniref:Fumarate hydratase class II n=1 Tax=Peptoniphilus koenoeneniae TaxID=507751 RepID=A0ABU0AUU5_9FIRM|nr:MULTISPECIES: class II fumarate hydratase [Peptoniphilus]ERT57344.1 fumarate hydratase, class II [Peptoniphilus sp. BV3C26]MDQ0275020.1 fumarate hydratase class II [Peptoniphilus koenoeneniae]
MDYRIEHDSIGEIRVPKDKYWAAQTERSHENFLIGTEKMPEEIIRAFAILKYGAAETNKNLNLIDEKKAGAIKKVCDEILEGKLDEHFPLVVWQTGSGTQSNMNVNEVIANRGNEILKEKVLHPNDDVNKSQSSNDTFPTALHISALLSIEEKLIPAIDQLEETFDKLSKDYMEIIKTGRTHLQDAVPLSLGQEISGWHRMLELSKEMIKDSLERLREIALGGTAVGTGLNAHKDFAELVAKEISKKSGHKFISAKNKFHALTSKDQLVFVHGAIRALACDMLKMANDVRLLASGPRCGIGEITIPANEPGSSIMPGKVNPTQAEALTMVCVQVMANDTAISIAASQGNYELNVYMPLIAYNFLQSVRLLSDALISFNKNCAVGIKPNMEKINENVNKSLMLVTALNPYIGYENAAKIAKKAHQEGTTLKEACLSLKLLTEEEFDKIVDPKKMVNLKR